MIDSLAQLIHGATAEQRFAAMRLGVALAALVALVVEVAFELRGSPVSSRAKKRAAGGLAVLAVVAYFQGFDLGYRYLLHRSEQFHYLLGAKYLPELGYERLYACSAVAEAERNGEEAVRARTMRDLHENRQVQAATALPDTARCREAFSPARWAAFRADVEEFRMLSETSYWKIIQNDHGFNGTPAWAVVGSAVGRLDRVSLTWLRLLATIDLGLMTATAGLVAWAFGWRVFALLVVFWGTQAASTLHWTGGAFLRQDGIACLLGAACFLRRGRPATAGVLLGYATLVRLYPLFLLAVLAASAAGAWWRQGRLPVVWRRLGGGALAAALVLLPASVLYGGSGSWPAFVTHIRMHDGTPTTNRMGWKAVVGHTASGRAALVEDRRAVDPYARWKALRVARLERLRPVVVGGMLAAALLLAWCAARLRTPWVALGVGVLSLTVHVGLTCYYHAFLVLTAPLSRARRPVELALVATAVLGNLATLRFAAYDDRYAVLSLLHIALGAFVALLFSRSPQLPSSAGSG